MFELINEKTMKMKRIKLSINFLSQFILIILFAIAPIEAISQFRSLEEQVDYYHERYKVNCVHEKITDNFGNGFETLYGTRNMRPILHGVAYRGGANNYYHRNSKRENNNPLPHDGLLNLCQEGFSDAVYLYSRNFSTAERSITSDNNTMNYHQISGNTKSEIEQIIKMVYQVINREIEGPLYFHCWNGWHQSGYVSSAILKQFCGYSDSDAFNYWMKNTDGVNKGYDRVKQMVRDFKPFDEYQISLEIQELICPCKSK